MTRPPRRRWQYEELEPRILYAADTAALASLGDIGSTFVVSTTADSGTGSLRDAITQANLHPGADTIRFDLPAPLVDGAHTITPRSALPILTDTVWLDASREPDALALGRPVVELVGTDAGGSASALVLADGSDGSLVRGLVISQFGGAAIQVRAGADGVTLAGLRIGTDVTGQSAPGNGSNAIEISAAQALVGGPTAADRNLLSGNNAGVQVTGPAAVGARIEGNYIGTDALGQSALGNRTVGVYLDAPSATVVHNLVSGNGYEGVYLLAGASGSTVQGNLIGTDVSGTRAVGNGAFGIYVENTRDVLIGGTTAGTGNLIAWQKAGAGISIVGTAGGVSVLGNAVHDNAGLGIDLGAEGVSGNREADTDGGPNNLLNYPVLGSATSAAGVTRLVGDVTGAAGTTLRIEFFASDQADPLGFGEGAVFLGSTRVTVGANGLAPIDTTLAGVLLQTGQVVSATATVQSATTAARPWGDSSEFGNAVPVQVVPSAPVVDAAQTLHVLENSPAGTVVGTLRATDADPGTTLSGWTLAGSPALAVDAATGTIRVVDPATLDHEQRASVVLTATVRDGVLSSAPQTLTVFIDNVNEPPALTLAPWKIQSDQPLTLGPAVLNAQDPDGSTTSLRVEVGTVTGGRFEAVNAPGTALAQFSLDALQSGQIRFVATAADQAPTVQLRVSDGSTFSAWTTVGVEWSPAPAPGPAPAPAPAPVQMPPLEPTPLLTVSRPTVRDAEEVQRQSMDLPALSGDRLPLSREVRAVTAEQWLAQVQADSSADIAALSAHSRTAYAGSSAAAHATDPVPPPDLLALVLPDTALAALQAGYALPNVLSHGVELPALAGDGLGQLRTDLQEAAGQLQSAIDPIEASGLALTVGLVWWTVRLGGVAGSLLVSVPTWQFFDPLPVLTRAPLPVRIRPGGAGAAGQDPQNEEASAAEVLGRDSPHAPSEDGDQDDGIDTTTGKPGTPGQGAAR